MKTLRKIGAIATRMVAGRMLVTMQHYEITQAPSSYEKDSDSPDESRVGIETIADTFLENSDAERISRNHKKDNKGDNGKKEKNKKKEEGVSGKYDIAKRGIHEDVIEYLNGKTGKKFSAKSQETRRLIDARVKAGYSLEDFRKVIDTKVSKWGADPKMVDYLRPNTLFGTKFEAYLNEGGVVSSAPGGRQPSHGESIRKTDEMLRRKEARHEIALEYETLPQEEQVRLKNKVLMMNPKLRGKPDSIIALNVRALYIQEREAACQNLE